MKIIFSRKGFDSSCGGVASPIFNGRVLSLPIPEPWPQPHGGGTTYGQIRSKDAAPTGRLVGDLTGSRLTSRSHAHLDPDLDAGNRVSRPPGWRPLFGQTGAAERHLQNQGVGAGDVFLFFGWFREAGLVGNRFQFRRDAPDLHLCFGWLQVDRRLRVAPAPPSLLPGWTAGHPHNKAAPYGPLDSIYTATTTLTVPEHPTKLPGAGVLERFDPKRVLTDPGGPSRIYWKLPAWFQPSTPGTALTYHSKPSRWHSRHGGVVLKTVCQGQEFVLDCDHYPQALPWLVHLLT